jgi:hypothetical protein
MIGTLNFNSNRAGDRRQMSDFTKEELQFILLSLEPFDWASSGAFEGVKSKIQSLIDNYCDHTSAHAVNLDVNYILECSECKAFKGWV